MNQNFHVHYYIIGWHSNNMSIYLNKKFQLRKLLNKYFETSVSQ